MLGKQYKMDGKYISKGRIINLRPTWVHSKFQVSLSFLVRSKGKKEGKVKSLQIPLVLCSPELVS